MKRTLALILSVIMVFGMIPMSLISALAHGPGVAKNDITNQSIHNALNQAIPEVVAVDGDYHDTAWDKDKWLLADKRFGVWDVEDPLANTFSYQYQLRVDTEYLYGVFRMSNASANELTVWLNDGSASGKSTDKLVLTLNGSSVTSTTINGVDMATADTNAGAYAAESYLVATGTENGGVIVEFRVFLKTFSESNGLTHFVSVKVGEESLYYPKVILEGETFPNSPVDEWPSNAIAIEKSDIENGYSDKHLPSDVTIDGKLDEVVWTELTDFRSAGNTSHQQKVEIANGTSAPLNLLAVGYSTHYTTNVPDHKHYDSIDGEWWNCAAATGGCDVGNLAMQDQLRFKYELRTDGTNLYGAIVLYDYGNLLHNIPSDFYDNGVYNWPTTYANASFVTVTFYDANGNSYNRMLEMVLDKNGSRYKLGTTGYGDLEGQTIFTHPDGTQETMTITQAYTAGKNAGILRQTDQLIHYEFKIPLNYIDNSLKTGTGTAKNFKVSIKAFEEGNFAHVYDLNGNALSSDKVSAWAKTEAINGAPGVTLSTNNLKLASGKEMGTIATNGGLQASEWNALLAADYLVDSGYRTNGYAKSNVMTYQYDVVADYDFIYGAAVIVTDSAWKTNTAMGSANSFRLWLNNGNSAGGDAYEDCVSFWCDANGNTYISSVNCVTNATTNYKKQDGLFYNTSTNMKAYGLDAVVRVLTANDLKDPAKRTTYAALYTAIQQGRVAIVEFRVPLDMYNLSMDYHRVAGANNAVPQIRYYVSVEDGVAGNKGFVHPMQPVKTGATTRVFTPKAWDISYDKNITPEKVFDNININGIRNESYWNEYSDFIGINGSTGYYSEPVSSDDVFTYGQTLYVSRDHLYGFTILNGEAVPGVTKYFLYINNDPEYRTKATHMFTFSVNSDGSMSVSGRDLLNDRAIDTDSKVAIAGNILNGYSNLEFAIDTRIFDEDNSGFEYAVSADNKVGNDIISLHYPDPRHSVQDKYTYLTVTHFEPASVQEGSANIFVNNCTCNLSDNAHETGCIQNGWAQLYVVFDRITNSNGANLYKVLYVDGDHNGGGAKVGAIPDDGFMFTIYNTSHAENNPDEVRRNAMIAKYKSIFTVGAIFEIDGLDRTGNNKDHIQYRPFVDLLYVNTVNEGVKNYTAGMSTTAAAYAKHNGWAGLYIAFAPTSSSNLFKVVGVDNNCNGVLDLTFPAGGFIYHVYNNALDYPVAETGTYVNTNVYRPELLNKFTVGTVVHFDNLKHSDMTLQNMESFGYRFLEEDWTNRNHHFPSENHWEEDTALKIDSLKYFYPEQIEIDGWLNDSGWDENGWTRVEENVNGGLQSTNYATNMAVGFNYQYQLRTDGEYVYVAALMDVKSDGTPFFNEANQLNYLSVPSFRIWIQSKNSKYDGAISFTHLYDVRLGLGSESSQYKNWADYTETTINNINFDIHGQTSASKAWYMGNAVKPGCDVVTFDGSTITYENVKIRFAEHLPNGFKHPWGGNADRYSGKASVLNATSYGTGNSVTIDGVTYTIPASAVYGETEEIMENMTSGTNGIDEQWHSHTDTKGFTIANEHGMWRGVQEKDGAYKSMVEFKFKLSEIGCDNGEGFEYFVQAAASGIDYENPFTMIHPAPSQEPYQEKKSFNAYSMPFWRWDNSVSNKFNATTSYEMMLRDNYGPAVSLGAKVNDNYDGNGSNTIRFGGLYTEDYIRRQLVTNNYEAGYNTTDTTNWTDRDLNGALKDGVTNYWDVAKVGIVLAPTSKLTKGNDGKVLLELGTPGSASADSVGIYQWRQNSNFADYEKYAFYVNLNNIPDAAKDMKFSFRSFVDYYDIDGSPTYYDYILERSYNSIENAANKIPMPDDETTGGGDDDDDGDDDDQTGGGGEAEIVKPNYNGMKLAYIPLDNRPVNLDRGVYLAESVGFDLLVPDEDLIRTEINNADTANDDSSVGNPVALFQWLQDVENDVYGKDVNLYVISLDQLLSGGLVGSRDYAGINLLPNAANDGATYDVNLTFEKQVIDFLVELTSDKNNKVVFFDSQMRLASTGQFNGYSSNNDDADGDKIYENHYSFFRYAYAMIGRPGANINADNALDQIFKNYEKKADGSYILGESIYQADGKTLAVDPNKVYTLSHHTTPSLKYEVTASFVDRYLKSRERKMKISELLFDSGVVANSTYFYVGIDDSSSNATIQTIETSWLKNKGSGIDQFSVFSGIDEIGIMSMAALVTELYGSVPVSVQYFGVSGAENFIADAYAQDKLWESVNDHIEGMGAEWASSSNKQALQVLVLTKKSADNSNGTANDPDAKYVNELISKVKSNITAGIPTAVIDGSAGTRDLLGRAMRDNGIDLGKLLGYGNWNTVANAIGCSLSLAIARYSYLKGSAEVTDESNVGFFKALSYAYIKDIGYIIEYKDHYAGADTLANRKTYKSYFDTTANNLVTQLNASSIMTGLNEDSTGIFEKIGDIRITKELYWPWNRNFEASFGLGVFPDSSHLGDNLTSGKSYQAVYSPHTNTEWLDPNGTKLTDGVWNSKEIHDGAWIVTTNGTGMTLTFDLGSSQELFMAKAIGISGNYGIARCDQVKVYVSDDGTTYNLVEGGALVIENSEPNGDWVRNYLSYYLPSGTQGRYVKVFIQATGSNHVAINEVEVYGVK